MNIFLDTVIGIIIGIITISVLFFTIISLLNLNDKKNKEYINEFISTIKNTILDRIVNLIDEYSEDINVEYFYPEDFIMDVLDDIYDNISNFIVDKMENLYNETHDFRLGLVIKFLDKDRPKHMLKYIENILTEFEIQDYIDNIWRNKAKINNYSSSKEDKKLQEEFSNSDYMENSEDIELPPPVKEDIPETVLKSLNPQKDDEEEYDPSDSSMEIVNEE